MLQAVQEYLAELAERFGDGWNRFWYQPRLPHTLAVLRIGAGLVLLAWHLSFTGDLVRWFGPDGLLPAADVQAARTPPRFSLLDYAGSATDLWIVHWAAAAAIVLFTVGLWTRVANVAALVFMLSYVHRAPMLSGQVEPVLSMVLLYLIIGPAGACYSVDALLRSRRARSENRPDEPPAPSFTATISTRLIQVHLAGFYLLMGLAKVAGATWWDGSAVWWLIAHPESRFVNLTWLYDNDYLLSLWTHAIVAFELGFPILVWNRLARPLLLAVAVVMWVLLAVLTGLLSFAAIMIVATAAFVPPEWIAGRSASRAELPGAAERRPARSPLVEPAGRV